MKTLALVTGGAGFIGSHIVDRLLVDGYRVRVLDNFSTGKRENLPESGDLEIITGDVGSFDDVHKAMKDVELVFHEAAIASVPKTIQDPIGSQRTNYLGTLNVLEAARQQGARRVVFASSAAVYGDLPELPKREDMPLKPLSPYAVDKLASEYACQMYTHLHGLETVCLRYFNVYGPRQDPGSPYSGVISIFAERLKKGRAAGYLRRWRTNAGFCVCVGCGGGEYEGGHNRESGRQGNQYCHWTSGHTQRIAQIDVPYTQQEI